MTHSCHDVLPQTQSNRTNQPHTETSATMSQNRPFLYKVIISGGCYSNRNLTITEEMEEKKTTTTTTTKKKPEIF
jgi:hypothetical protein